MPFGGLGFRVFVDNGLVCRYPEPEKVPHDACRVEGLTSTFVVVKYIAREGFNKKALNPKP